MSATPKRRTATQPPLWWRKLNRFAWTVVMTAGVVATSAGQHGNGVALFRVAAVAIGLHNIIRIIK